MHQTTFKECKEFNFNTNPNVNIPKNAFSHPQNPYVCKLGFLKKKNPFAFFQCCPMHLN